MSDASAVVYRRATLDDVHDVCVLGQAVNALHHAAWPDLFSGPSDPSRDAPHWRKSIEDPQCAAFVAVAGIALVGFVTGAWTDETNALLQPIRLARIHTLCVEPAWRRRGIGRALMAEAERWASDAGAHEVRLNVWSFNRDARELYVALGYAERSLTLGKRLARST